MIGTGCPVAPAPGSPLSIRVSLSPGRKFEGLEMWSHGNRNGGRFCWVDLAATDENAARLFYTRLFDWTTRSHRVEDGRFDRFFDGDDAVGSLYQLSRRHLSQGVPSHWTPYVSVADADGFAARAEDLGASVVVAPFDVRGIARVALVQDPIGALFGLWQARETAPEEEQTARC